MTPLTEPEGGDLENRTFRILRWRLIPLLLLCYVASYLDRVNLGFAKLQMLGDLHFSETTYGLGAGVFFVSYLVCGVPCNLALHRLGARRWLALIMVTWGILSGLTAFITTPTQFFVLRFLLGAAESGFNPGVILYLTHWFPNARRAGMVSMYQTAIPLAGTLGGPLSGWILDHLDGRLQHRGWQWLFVVEALPAVILGLIVLWRLTDRVSEASFLTPSQRDLVAGLIARERSEKEQQSLRAVLSDWRVWSLSMLALGLSVGLYAISFWAPTLLKEAGVQSSTETGLLTAIPNAIAIPSMLLLARNSDRHHERRWHVAGAALLGAAGLTLSALFTHQVLPAVLALTIAAVGILSAMPLQWSFVTAFMGGAGGAAAIGFVNSVGSLGGLIIPPLIGWLKDRTGSMEGGLLIGALFSVLSASLALRVPARLVNK